MHPGVCLNGTEESEFRRYRGAWAQTTLPFESLLFVLANIFALKIGLFLFHLDAAGGCATSLQSRVVIRPTSFTILSSL